MNTKSQASTCMETLLHYGIWGCFFALILTPFGLPIPEEISLLTAGALVGNGHSEFWMGWLLGFLGVTLGDVISWSFGRTVGLEPTGFVSKLIGSKQIDDIERFYRRFGDWTIVIARQILACVFLHSSLLALRLFLSDEPFN